MYWSSDYVYIEQRMTQTEAEVHCEQQGMLLAKPLTTEELEVFLYFVKWNVPPRQNAWTGLTRTTDGATDEVTDIGGEWDNGNPSGDGTCTEITKHGLFNDLSCIQHSRPAICQTRSMYICH